VRRINIRTKWRKFVRERRIYQEWT